MRINEPERPGRIMLQAAIIPHKKRYQVLLFSSAGVRKVINIAVEDPIIKVTTTLLEIFEIVFPTEYTEARMSPKKKAHIKTGKFIKR